jgi:decaprenyl-phosphate phosphoribosyltransferase
MRLALALIRLSRPVHWIKNLGVFAALLLSGNLLSPNSAIAVVEAFIAFNLITSATYVFNDIMDSERDKLHPTKKNRPVASGLVPKHIAIIYCTVLVVTGLTLSALISQFFTLLVLIYLFMQLGYSLGLKNISVLDIMIIATGFVIRVYAGAYIIDAHLSVWFHLCVIATSLFLASGKRRAEIGLVGEGGKTRASLQKYTKETLSSFVSMFGTASWISWSLFTFYESPKAGTPLVLFLSEISRATTISKLLMVTIPITIFGIMRYQLLIFEEKTEAPEKVLLKDPLLLISGISWLLIVVIIYYGGLSA